MSKQRDTVDKAIGLMTVEMKQHFVSSIMEAMDKEQITEVLLALDLIGQDDAGEILTEGLFAAMHEAFDEVFKFDSNEQESGCESSE
jgi:hypothetical protein